MKQNELFNKCCENIDPRTREEVWKQMDKELGRTTLEQAAEAYSLKRVGGIILDDDVKAFKAGVEWQRKQDELTWEDIKEMSEIMDFMIMVEGYSIDCERDYKEVLKRFKEYKKLKNKEI